MSLRSWQVAALLAATLTMGLMAGVFGVYANAIMRGLTSTDDRTFVRAFQAIDRAIVNPLFMLTFTGALVLTGTAGVLYLRGDDGGSIVPWVAVAFGLYLAVFIITVAVHVPLNDGIKAAGDPDHVADLAAVRDAFHEARWIAWNVVRALATTAAFACLAWALVLHGRADGNGDDTHRLTTPQATHLGAATWRRRPQPCSQGSVSQFLPLPLHFAASRPHGPTGATYRPEQGRAPAPASLRRNACRASPCKGRLRVGDRRDGTAG